MMEARSPNILFMWIFILLAFPLSVIPLSESLQWWRPAFLALMSIYFALVVPEKFGVICAGIVGFFLDIIEGNLLGQSAIAFSVVICLVLLQYQRIRMFSLLQQVALVFMLVSILQIISYWLEILASQLLGYPPVRSMSFFRVALSSALCWPILVIVMKKIRQLFGLI